MKNLPYWILALLLVSQIALWCYLLGYKQAEYDMEEEVIRGWVERVGCGVKRGEQLEFYGCDFTDLKAEDMQRLWKGIFRHIRFIRI